MSPRSLDSVQFSVRCLAGNFLAGVPIHHVQGVGRARDRAIRDAAEVATFYPTASRNRSHEVPAKARVASRGRRGIVPRPSLAAAVIAAAALLMSARLAWSAPQTTTVPVLLQKPNTGLFPQPGFLCIGPDCHITTAP